MFKLIYLTLLLTSPQLVFADSENYESFKTLEMLVDYLGEPANKTKFIDQKMQFTHYYYQELNQSFVISDEIWEVCNTYQGDTILSCFPCAIDEVSAECP